MEKILVIQLSRMGDLLQTFPLLQRLKQDPPAREITLVCLREFLAVVQNQPWFDRLVPLELRDVRNLCHQANPTTDWSSPPFCEVSEFADQYDLVVNLTHDEGSAALCEKIQSRRKSGRIRALPNEIRLLGDWSKYFFAAVNNRTQNLFNLVDIYMGIGGARHRPTSHYFRVGKVEEQEALDLIREAGYVGKGKLVAFQMGASEPRRAWPVEKFAALDERLTAESDLEIVLVGNRQEVELGKQFSRFTGSPVINLIGKTEIQNLAALLKRCDLLVSNDTGTIHLAAAVGTQTVGLYFSTAYFAETAPYGDGHIVLQVENASSPSDPSKFSPDSRGADFLPVEAVLAACRKALHQLENVSCNFPNLAIYQSRLLANGTLLYVPVAGTSVSPLYLASLISRVMWEKALGLEMDAAFLAASLSSTSILTDFEKIRIEYSRTLSDLRMKFSEGVQFARQKLAAPAQVPSDDHPTREFDHQLTRTVKEISGLTQTLRLFTDFFHFEIMDLDFLPKLALAEELERKFAKLERFSTIFLETLQKIDALPRTDGESAS